MKETLTLDGFVRVVLLEDMFVLLFGIYIGGFIMLFLISNILSKIKSIENKHFEKMNYVEFTDNDGKKTYFVNKNKINVLEIIRSIFLVIFCSSFRSKPYVAKNEKKAKILVRILLILGVLIAIMAIRAILNVTIPPL